MSTTAEALLRIAWDALGGSADATGAIAFAGRGELPSVYPVTDLASAAIATAAIALLELRAARGDRPATATIDRRLASFWFGLSIRPLGWNLPPLWDPLAGDYRTRDGWIKLHTNAPHHRAAAERVLGPHANRNALAPTIAGWAKGDLESAIIEAGGCAAELRTAAEWAAHPQGRAVAAEPLAHLATPDAGPAPDWPVTPARPLAGVRVLDLTRVLAGPVASRFLAGYGAEVLRIDPPEWDEPAVAPEVTLGKRCARLDLRRADDRARFTALLSKADILLHGYRPGALDQLGFDSARRRVIAPGLIDVSLGAYGFTGRWATRRGFDSLVQMSTGIAEAGMRWRGADQPVPLPVQALDQATGYLMAAAAIRGITRRLLHHTGIEARFSLARIAGWLSAQGVDHATSALLPETPADLSPTIENTEWGPAHRLYPPITIADTQMRWEYPAGRLGAAAPRWN